MKLKGALCIILSGVIFGLMPIAAKAIYANGGNSQLLTFLRYLFSLPLLWLLRRREKHAEQLWLPGVEKDEDIREEDRK